MDYFIRWQFTNRSPVPFKTQEEIIVSALTPLVKEESFRACITNFYITKIDFITVRLQVLTTDPCLEKIQNTVESSTTPLVLVNKEGPNPNPEIVDQYGPSDLELYFRKYLEDITLIGLDLHQNNLLVAKQFAIKAKFSGKPRGTLHPREILEEHFHLSSEHYRLLGEDIEEMNKFWSGFCYQRKNYTPWDHFYYNIVLGADAYPFASQENFAKSVGVPVD